MFSINHLRFVYDEADYQLVKPLLSPFAKCSGGDMVFLTSFACPCLKQQERARLKLDLLWCIYSKLNADCKHEQQSIIKGISFVRTQVWKTKHISIFFHVYVTWHKQTCFPRCAKLLFLALKPKKFSQLKRSTIPHLSRFVLMNKI